MQRKHSHFKIPRNQFTLRLNTNDRDLSYNALSDPHANAYFASRAAKQRLRHLKSGIKSERGWKSPQRKEMVKMIKSKIKGEIPRIKLPLLQGKEREQKRKQAEILQLMKHKRYTQQMRSARLEASQSGLEMSIDNEGGAGGLGKSKSKKAFKATRKSIEKGKVGHTDFVSFLARKKEILEQTAQTTQVNETTL